jgi:glycosyltransferase involved in cell wall biosynthesis
MSTQAWLLSHTMHYLTGGGHLWVYLNWALGLREAGCDVTWLEVVPPEKSPEEALDLARKLQDRLRPFGLADRLALCSIDASPLHPSLSDAFITLDHASSADVLLNLRYGTDAAIIKQFKRSILLDIDPGLLQLWMSRREVTVAPHDLYYSIGPTVGKPGSAIPSLGLAWHHTPPAVAASAWPVTPPGPDAAFNTISHWQAAEWVEVSPGDYYCNNKRAGFEPFLDLPLLTHAAPLELALCLHETDEPDKQMLLKKGWRIVHSYDVSSTLDDYQRYIQNSLGEFGCAKPSCVRMQNAWVSDRTLCYLASGKPVIVLDTGPSDILPDDQGMFRYKTVHDAARAVDRIMSDYPNQCRLARQLAVERFDAKILAKRMLERALEPSLSRR